MALEQLLPGVPAEILRGQRVIEVRARGVNKGAYVSAVFPNGKPKSQFVLAAGDDRTDLDLYGALPPGSVAVYVGRRWARAREVSLRDQFAVDSPMRSATCCGTSPPPLQLGSSSAGLFRRARPGGTTPGRAPQSGG